MLRAGTSNIVLSEPNKQAFPEAFRSKSRLTYYSTLFNSLEVNSSFYKVPMAATVRKWATEVPDDFQFTFKCWKEITHRKGLLFDPAHVRNFMQVIDAVGHKKGCLLLQLPPGSTEKDLPQLERLLEEIALRQTAHAHGSSSGDHSLSGPGFPATSDPAPPDPWRIAIEFRHRNWYTAPVLALLDRHHASLVLHDMPASAIDRPNKEAPFIYLRYHGPKGDYKGSYPDAFLRQQADRIREWMEEGKEVYAYFNNTVDADAPANVRTLSKFVKTALPI